jgi:hypothetical protein
MVFFMEGVITETGCRVNLKTINVFTNAHLHGNYSNCKLNPCAIMPKNTKNKKPKRCVKKTVYYVADTLPPQPKLIVDIIRAHGTIERSTLLKELESKISTCQPIPWLFSYHKAALIKAHYFKEVKEPVIHVPSKVKENLVPSGKRYGSVTEMAQELVPHIVPQLSEEATNAPVAASG